MSVRLVPTLALAWACGGREAPVTPEVALPAPGSAPVPIVRHTLRFEPIEVPADPLAMREAAMTGAAVVDGVSVPIGFHTLYRTGDQGFGAKKAQDGRDLGEVCPDQDFDGLLEAGGRPWLIHHFECIPGATWLTELDKEPDGRLTPVGSAPIPWDAWGGTWFPCSGQVSPWGTHLGSEEYEPDARQLREDGTMAAKGEAANWKELARYLTDPSTANPYLYGWPTQIAVAADGTATPRKHYAMGRFSHELSYVLPDRKTVYQSDDGTATGFFLFVADVPGDLDAGTLYAARFETAGEVLRTSWVDLGHADQPTLAALVARRPRFSDLFEAATPDDQHRCAEGFTWVNHHLGEECLKLAAPSERVPDPALAASRLETRRYAAMLGASTELEKTEGVTFDPESRTVFLAASVVRKRMLDEHAAGYPSDGVRLEPNRCGVVLGGVVGAGVSDTSGEPIPSDAVLTELRSVVAGVPLPEPDAVGNACSPDAIANPDNLTFLPGYGLLTIAEDTKWGKGHAVASLWTFDVRDHELRRVLVAPPGGEVTGIHWVPNLLGHGYLTATVQHPWSELEDNQPVPPEVTDADRRAFTGWIGPFPALNGGTP